MILYCFFLFQFIAYFFAWIKEQTNIYISTAVSHEGLLIKNDGIIQMP